MAFRFLLYAIKLWVFALIERDSCDANPIQTHANLSS